MIRESQKITCTTLFLFVFLAFIFFLLPLVDASPIVADGYQNLSAAKNMLDFSIFSSSDAKGSSPIPDMQREPAWPFFIAIFLYIFSLDFSTAVLASEFSAYFKWLNLSLYALVSSISCSWIYLKTKNIIFSMFVLAIFFLVYGTTPRLFNNLNNEALASLFLLVASILFYRAVSERGNLGGGTSFVFGLTLGLLALAKAQYLFICVAPLLFLFFFNPRRAALSMITLFIVVSPWIWRNYDLFNQLTIAERGKTVAAVRIILTSEATAQERLCMAYAFTHPSWQHHVEKILEINNSKFEKGGMCQRFNRETCFDMGVEKVKCAPFPEDLSQDYLSRTQLFYKGFHAGRGIEEGILRFSDIFEPDSNFFIKYIKTFPLFAWRGMGFSGYPSISIVISLSVLVLMFTRYWSFALLATSSWFFHATMTHNIPRYSATLIPIMILSATFLIYLMLIKYKAFSGSKKAKS